MNKLINNKDQRNFIKMKQIMKKYFKKIVENHF